MNDFRIRRQNELNWVIEEYHPSNMIESGKYRGKMSKPAWVIIGYYGKLRDIVPGLLDLNIKIGWTTSDIDAVLKEIDAAEKRILKVLEEMFDEEK